MNIPLPTLKHAPCTGFVVAQCSKVFANNARSQGDEEGKVQEQKAH